MANLKKGTTIEGFDIFNRGNHGVEGDPHPQYCKISDAYTSSFSNEKDRFFKVATISLTNKYDSISAILEILGGSTPENTPYAEVAFKVYQQNNMGQSPNVELAVLNSKIFTPSSFRAIITKATLIATEVELYAKIPQSFDLFSIKVSHSNRKGAKLKTSNKATSIPEVELPLGVKVTPTFPRSYATPKGDGTVSYAKIGTITVNSRYGFRAVTLEFQAIAAAAKTTFAKVLYKVQQQNDLGGRPNIEITVLELSKPTYLSTVASDFMAVEVNTTSSGSVIDLYVRSVPNFQSYFYKVLRDEGDFSVTSWNPVESTSLTPTLPSGYQTTGAMVVYDDLFMRSPNGSTFKVVVSDAGTLTAYKV